MRLNIFKNKNIDAQVGYLIDTYDHALRKKTESYWRNAIAKEIYDSCPGIDITGYPCEDCHEYFKFITSKAKISHER